MDLLGMMGVHSGAFLRDWFRVLQRQQVRYFHLVRMVERPHDDPGVLVEIADDFAASSTWTEQPIGAFPIAPDGDNRLIISGSMGDRGADGRHFATYVCKPDARLNMNAREDLLVRCSEGGRYFVHLIHVEAIRRRLGRFNQLEILFV